MTDDDVEKIIKRNMNLQMNLAGIRADFEEVQQRTWVGLTDDELYHIATFGNEWGGAFGDFQWQSALVPFVRAIEAKLKEKNT